MKRRDVCALKLGNYKWVLGLIVLLFMVMVTACSNEGNKDREVNASNVNENHNIEISDNDEPVTITFYRPNTGTTKAQFMDMMGTEIEKEFPHVTLHFIEDKEIDNVITSGEALDIVLLSIGFYAQYANYGLQFDHTDLINKYNYDLTVLEPTLVDFIQTFGENEIHSLPIFTTAFTLIYNMDLFDKFAVPYPTNDMSWDEAYDLAKDLTRNVDGVQYYGFGTSISHLLRVNQLSQPFVDMETMKPSIDTDEWRSFIENFARFYELGNIDNDNQLISKSERDMFTKDQTLAMLAYFNSAMIGAPEEMNLDAVRLPYFKEAPGVGSQLYPTFAGVVSISEHKDTAFKILTYLTSKEMQTKFAKDGLGLPVINDLSILKEFGENIGNLEGKHIENFYPDNPAPIPMQNLYSGIPSKHLRNALYAVVRGEKDVVTALREATEISTLEIDAAIEASK